MPTLPPNAVHLTTRQDWRTWLEQHHPRAEGVWLVSYKTTTSKPRIGYEESVEEALCFGWIDSTVKTLDAERTMQWFAPRKKRSGWSSSNKLRVSRLTAKGLMHPAGIATVEQAKADRSWTALDDVEALIVPPDLLAALAAYPHATRHFSAFPRSVRRGILLWISTAKRPQTRSARIQNTARLANKNVRANEWRPKNAAPTG